LADLDAALAWALRESGVVPADPLKPTDGELLLVADSDYNRLTDLALYAAAERIVDNLDPEQLAQLGVTEDAAALRRDWRARASEMLSRLKSKYGHSVPAPSAGSLGTGFAASGWGC